MSVRRRAKQRRRWAGWVGDGEGPTVLLIAEYDLSDPDVRVLFEVRDALLELWRQAERAIGRWEDDGGPPAPEHVHRTSGLTLGGRAT
ncbi:MAG TPA: hypothetical protein VH208_07560 [Myxococcaceae bacterium]|jgi:hypothetical protein|nr:hypothetical protein [Myxococcaceae bacterium]